MQRSLLVSATFTINSSNPASAKQHRTKIKRVIVSKIGLSLNENEAHLQKCRLII